MGASATEDVVGSRGEVQTGEPAMPPVVAKPGQKIKAIDKIRMAFSDRQWQLYVPEWDITVYFRALTMSDMEAVQMAAGHLSSGPDGRIESQQMREVKLLIHKARDDKGLPLFAAGDVYSLMHETRADVLQRCVNFMFTCGALTPEEAKKELGEGSTSATTSSSPEIAA